MWPWKESLPSAKNLLSVLRRETRQWWRVFRKQRSCCLHPMTFVFLYEDSRYFIIKDTSWIPYESFRTHTICTIVIPIILRQPRIGNKITNEEYTRNRRTVCECTGGSSGGGGIRGKCPSRKNLGEHSMYLSMLYAPPPPAGFSLTHQKVGTYKLKKREKYFILFIGNQFPGRINDNVFSGHNSRKYCHSCTVCCKSIAHGRPIQFESHWSGDPTTGQVIRQRRGGTRGWVYGPGSLQLYGPGSLRYFCMCDTFATDCT